MPTISLAHDKIPFLLGGTGALAIDTGELALDRPIAPDAPPLLKAGFEARGAMPLSLGQPDSVRVAITANSLVLLQPIFPTSSQATRRVLDAYRLTEFLASPEHRGTGILCFTAAASSRVAATAIFNYAALRPSVTLDTGGDAAYSYLRAFDVNASVQKVVTEFFQEMRLPEQGTRAPVPGEAIALEFGGYLRLGVEVPAGYQLAGTKSIALGQLALSERYDLSIVGKIGLSAGVAGRYSLLVTAGPEPGWARVIVTRRSEHELRCAADVTVGFKNELDLPGSAHEFIGAALGVNGKNFINLFTRALELSDFDRFKAATDGLARQFVEALIGRAFDTLAAKTEFTKFMALVARVVESRDTVGDRAVSLFDRYFDRIAQLASFLEELQTLTGDAFGRLRERLTPERWTMLAQLTDGDPLAFLLEQVVTDGRRHDSRATLKARADAALELVRGRAHEDLRRVLAIARQQFGIDQFFRELAKIDTPDELKAVANERLGTFVSRLVGRRLDSAANVKAALAEIRAVLQNVDAFSTKLFQAFKEASNSSYGTALHAEYSRASSSDALVDVLINAASPRGLALLRQAGRGDFEEVLTTPDTNVVRLQEGVFTHRTSRHSPFHVNIVGWHLDYQYEGFDRVITETEQRLVPSAHGITIFTTASLEVERRRKRRDETVHVNFLLRALGESAGVLKSRSGDLAYVVDVLSSLSARYQLSFTDEDTSAIELTDYLAFAQEVGLGPKGATFEHLAPLLPRTGNGGFGAITTSYDVRFGRAALDALLSVTTISPTGEKAIRQGLRQIVLANYLKTAEMHDVAFAYATPAVFDVFREEGAALFTARSQRTFGVALAGATVSAPASVVLDRMELNVLATLYNIENALLGSMKDLYKVIGGKKIDLAKFEQALSGFGDAMKLFDDFDQTSRALGVGANTLFVMFDRLVRLASRGPSTTGATAATLRLTSRAGDRTVEKLFLSDAAVTS